MSIVRKATEADLVRLCRAAMHAFADDPIFRWFYPDDADYFAGDGATLRPFIRRWLAYDCTYTTDDGVSLAAFIPPGRPEVEVEPEPFAIPPSEELLAKFMAIGPAMHEHTPPETHWYLNMLGTHPHWQRQGLGTLVMSPITELCDRDGLPLYLETETVANVAYYSHLGFTVRSEWDVPLDGPHMWGMLRRPQP
jgi:GNAT superfamily N-acetyltransferase